MKRENGLLPLTSYTRSIKNFSPFSPNVFLVHEQEFGALNIYTDSHFLKYCSNIFIPIWKIFRILLKWTLAILIPNLETVLVFFAHPPMWLGTRYSQSRPDFLISRRRTSKLGFRSLPWTFHGVISSITTVTGAS